MNLHLNLILDSELRSGSQVTRKFIIRVAAVSVPVIILGIMIPLFFALRHARSDLVAAREEKARLDPVHRVVVRLREELAGHRRLLNEVEGWRDSRLDWYELFVELQTIVPHNAQLTRFVINERIEPSGGVPARQGMMMLRGKVVGSSASEDIQQLDKDIRENHVFSSLISDMDVRLLGASESLKDPDVRLFDATCYLVPRKMRAGN